MSSTEQSAISWMKLIFPVLTRRDPGDDLAPCDFRVDDGLATAAAVVDHHDEILHAGDLTSFRVSRLTGVVFPKSGISQVKIRKNRNCASGARLGVRGGSQESVGSITATTIAIYPACGRPPTLSPFESGLPPCYAIARSGPWAG